MCVSQAQLTLQPGFAHVYFPQSKHPGRQCHVTATVDNNIAPTHPKVKTLKLAKVFRVALQRYVFLREALRLQHVCLSRSERN